MRTNRWPGPLGGHNENQTQEERRNLQTIVQGTVDFNLRNVEGTASSFSKSYEWTSPFFDFQALRGVEQTKWGLSEVLNIFPDAHYEIMINIAQGSYTQTASLVTGSRINGFMGFPPKRISYNFMVTILNKFDSSGNRVWTWEMFDRLEILRQMGVLPSHMNSNNSPPSAQPPILPPPTPTAVTTIGPVPPYRPGGGDWQTIERRNYESVARGIVAFNARNAMQSVADLSPDSVWYSNALPAPIVGRGPAGRWIAKSFEILPDTTFELLHMFAWRNFVQVLFLASGTQSLGFLGMPPSDKPFQYYRSVLSQYDQHGQRIKVWDVWDEAEILRAQGFMPPLPPVEFQAPGTVSASLPPATEAPALPGGPITGADLELLEKKSGPQVEVEIRTMLKRLASFDLVGRLATSEPLSDPDNPTEGLLEIELFETSVIRSLLTSAGGKLGSARLSWRISPEAHGLGPSSGSSPGIQGAPQQIDMQGTMDFADAQRSQIRLRGFGLANAVPGPRFPAGAILQIESGSGALQKKHGMVTISVDDHDTQTVRLVMRVGDPTSSFRSTSLALGTKIPSPASKDLVVTLEGSEDPERPVQFDLDSHKNFVGARAYEKLSIADFRSGLDNGSHLKARTRKLGLVGSSRFLVHFAASTDPTDDGISYTTQQASIQLFDTSQRALGSLEANIARGRAFPAHIAGVDVPAFRMGGLAPIIRGHGLFEDARGWIVVNSLFSLVPRIISSVLTLHLVEPRSDLSEQLARAWQ